MSEPMQPAEKVKQFPCEPGVYLMKDAQGRVLYVGKAKNLRNRAGHYFTRAAAEDHRSRDLVPLIAAIDFAPAPGALCPTTRTPTPTPPPARWTPCSWRLASSRTFSRASTSSCATTRPS